MNRFLNSLALALILFVAVGVPVISVTGCAAPRERIAFNAADTALTSAKIAMKEWWTYVVKEEDRIAALSPLDRGTASADLLRKEGRVMNAYGAYQSVLKTSSAAVKASTASNTALPDEVGKALAELVSLVKALQK